MHQLKFRRHWVNGRLDGLWEEMSGIKRTFPARYTAPGGRVPDPGASPVDLDYARRYIPFSELNAARLIHLVLEDRITYVGSETNGVWYFFNEVYHCEVEEGTVGDMVAEAFADQMRMAMDQVSIEIENRAAQDANPANMRKTLRGLFKEHYAYQQKLFSESGLNALKARFRKQCTKGASYFDNDRRWLVCQNGVIDLDGFRKTKTIQDNFRPHNPEFPVKRAVECKFNPGNWKEMSPNWAHFLETSIPDEEVRAFLQRLVGAAFLAESKVKAIPNLQGPKDCGKTIFVSTLERLAGGYGVQPSGSALMLSKGGATNFEQDTLRGMRFVGISEPNPNERLDDEFCKKVTGGDEVRTRTLNKASVPWLPQCVIFIASNSPVNFTTYDQAFVERICLVEFPHRFWDVNEAMAGEIHIKDYTLEDKLAGESEGIFLWVILGMRAYLDQGINKPESVKMAGERFVVESSGPLSWIDEKVSEGLLTAVEDPMAYPLTNNVLCKKLYATYAGEMKDLNDRPVGKIAFNRHLETRFRKTNSAGLRFVGLVGTGSYMHLNDDHVRY